MNSGLEKALQKARPLSGKKAIFGTIFSDLPCFGAT
jgi:hypothetical protein